MVRVLYGDILLLIDFCMNFFALYTSSVILRRRIKVLCIVGASTIGGIYSVAKIFVSGNDIIDCVLSFAVGLLMCYICFGGCGYFKSMVVFYSVSALVGGIMYAAYFFLGSYHSDIYGNFNEYAYAHIPIWLFTVLAAISMVISLLFSYIGRERTDKKDENAIIEFLGKRVEVKLLLDSGNLTKEPISGKRVVMIGRVKAKKLLGEEICLAISEKNTEYLLLHKFRLICACGIDGMKRTYYAFKPDKFYIKDVKSKVQMDAYIAVCDTEVLFGDCDGLAHPSVVV